MKKLLVFAVFVVSIVTTTNAQSEKYYSAMGSTLQQMGDAKTAESWLELASKFERIAEAEKTQWLPYYYAALCQAYAGFSSTKIDKDAVGNKARELCDKAAALDNNSELYVVRYMAATIQMMVDPMNRWQQYGQMAQTALDEGFKLDKNNPRLYYMQGQSMFNTPPAFGGGKDKAKPMFQKAVDLYKSQPKTNPLMPSWGETQAADMLAKCG
ncbi:MAG: tetratricopeptide repeat protein [Chitinophagaceae bacterium]